MTEETEVAPPPVEAEATPAPAAPADPAPPPELVADEPAAPPEPKKEPWWEARLRQKTAQQKAAEARAAELERELAAYRSAQADKPAGDVPEPAPKVAPKADDIRAEARRLLDEERRIEDTNRWVKAGNDEFKDFNEKSATLASLGATEKPEFVQALVAIKDGHKLVPKLADDPDEAMRILALPPLKMAAELGRMAAALDAAPKKPISNAPRPVAPIGGSARAAADDIADPKLSMAEWVRLREKQEKARREARR